MSSVAGKVLILRKMVAEFNTILNITYADLVSRYTMFEDNKCAEEATNVPKNKPRTKQLQNTTTLEKL